MPANKLVVVLDTPDKGGFVLDWQDKSNDISGYEIEVKSISVKEMPFEIVESKVRCPVIPLVEDGPTLFRVLCAGAATVSTDPSTEAKLRNGDLIDVTVTLELKNTNGDKAEEGKAFTVQKKTEFKLEMAGDDPATLQARSN